MKYSEYMEEIKKLGFEIEDNNCDIRAIDTDGRGLSYVDKLYPFAMDTDWIAFDDLDDDIKSQVLDLNYQLARTPIEDREDEKRFIIPLPRLVTTDGKQQFLSYSDGYYFASRMDENLMQIWKESYLEIVPEIYRQFAVEFDE